MNIEYKLVFSVTTSTDIQSEIENSNSFLLYPIPSRDFIYLDFKNSIKPAVGRIEIFDIKGQKVFNKEINSNQNKLSLDISSLKIGVYSVVVITKNEKYIKRIVKL